MKNVYWPLKLAHKQLAHISNNWQHRWDAITQLLLFWMLHIERIAKVSHTKHYAKKRAIQKTNNHKIVAKVVVVDVELVANVVYILVCCTLLRLSYISTGCTASVECPCSVSFLCAWIRSHRFHVNGNVYDWTDERSLVRPFDEFPCNAYARNCDRWLESNGAFYVNVQRLGLWIFYSRCHCHSHLLSISAIHFLCFTLLLLHCHSTHRLPSIANSKFYMTHSLFYCLNGTFFVLPTERPANWIKTKLDVSVHVGMCALIHALWFDEKRRQQMRKTERNFGMKGIWKIPIGVIDEVILSLYHRTYK